MCEHTLYSNYIDVTIGITTKEAGYTELHKVILEMLQGKQSFVLSTNADGQFSKVGLSENKIFCTQGDYFHIQCARGCHQKTYEAVALFRQMDQARIDCRTC